MEKDSPLEIDAWKAKHPLVTVLAKQAAIAPDATHGFLEILRTGEGMEKLPPLPRLGPTAERWRNCTPPVREDKK